LRTFINLILFNLNIIKTCSECKGKITEKYAKTPEGFSYKYYKCNNCNEETLDMKQLHNITEKYKK